MRRIKTIIAVALCMVLVGSTSVSFADINISSKLEDYGKISNITSDTIIGADMSYCQKMQEWEKSYKDFDGNAQTTAFEAFKQAGINTIEVKIAMNPDDGNNAYLSLTDAIKTIKAAKEEGFNTNAVLLFADWLTGKDDQPVPEQLLNEEKKVEDDKVTEYVNSVMDAFKDADAMPTIITVGNEVNYNFLGQKSEDYLGGWWFMGTATSAIRAYNSNVKISIGLAAPNSEDGTVGGDGIKWMLEKLNNSWYRISYDYVGVKIYSTWHTTEYVENLVSTFSENTEGKQLYIADIDSLRSEVMNRDDSVDEQTAVIYNCLKSTITEENAGGIVYNRADVVADWLGTSLFDEYGTPAYSLAVLAKAQGLENAPSEIIRNPYQYGDETGAKDQDVFFKKISGMNDGTIKGVDASCVQSLLNAGVKFYDNNGKEEDVFKVMADNGVNYSRIRIWVDPYDSNGNTYGGGANDLANALKMGKSAYDNGMKILLCMQYSDFWTDPAQQHVPKAWSADVNNQAAMEKHVYDYTVETIKAFQDAGVQVSMVQVGNEITNGFLGIYASRSKHESYLQIWGDEKKSKQINAYLNAGAKAVRKTAPDAQIILQLETPDVKKYTNIMNTWKRDKVDYDVLGTSYYPFWSVSAKSNTPETLKSVMKLAADYNKLCCVMETAWAYTKEDSDGTPNSIGASTNFIYDVGPQGQVDMLTDLYTTIASQPNAMGAFYWEPSWIPVYPGYRFWQENKDASNEFGTGWASEYCKDYLDDDKYYYHGEEAWGGSSWDNNSLFDFNGYPLKSLAFYKEAASKDNVQRTMIKIINAKGEVLGTVFKDITVGKTVKVTLPKITGYDAPEKVYSTTIKGNKSGTVISIVKYTAAKAEPKPEAKPGKLIVKLSESSYVYNGKAKKPLVTVTCGGKTLMSGKSTSNSNIKLTYAEGRTKVGTYKVTVKGLGNYAKADTVTMSFKIKPAKTSISKLTSPSKNKIKVTWKKKTAQVTGYQIQYSTSSKFTKKKTATVKSNKTTKTTISKLTSGKRYYVRIRTYKTVGKTKYYSAWSAVKNIKAK